MMRLEQLLKNLDDYRDQAGIKDFEVKGVTADSKNVSEDFIFVAIKGTHCDGHEYIDDAIEKGARVVLVQSHDTRHKSQEKAQFIVVNDTRKAMARLVAEFYGNPSKSVRVVGITGTNGKTTISYLLEAILREAGKNPAVIGTVNYRFNQKILPSKNTTPGPQELQPLLKEMLDSGVDYALMEVSSHALDQDRVGAIDFHSAIFTNLTQDHLDYHQTMENYFLAKTKLFKNIHVNAFAVINNDDTYAKTLKALTRARVITYGLKYNVDALAKDIKFDLSHTEFTLRWKGKEEKINSRLIGRHNVYNILASVAWAMNEGISFELIKSAIEKFDLVPGRLERIDSKKGFFCFVDYAHTEDALYNVINALKEVCKQKIILVFGCGGERDKTKRPKMGKVATDLADSAIITNDNPRSEDPLEIVSDIKKGITKDNYCVILDRREAIKKALNLARPGDAVLIAGKGHENYQILKEQRIAFDDREVVAECLK